MKLAAAIHSRQQEEHGVAIQSLWQDRDAQLEQALEQLVDSSGPQEIWEGLGSWLQSPRRATLVLNKIARSRQAHLCCKAIDVMQEQGVETNVFHISCGMSACEKSGLWQLALGMLRRMPSLRVLPTVISFGAGISACEKGGQWEMGLSLLREMREMEVFPSEICYNAAISACEKGNQWRLAVSLLKEMPKVMISASMISFSASISACEKSSQWQLGLSLLREMLEETCLPDHICYNAAISACEKGRQWQEGLALLREMPGAKLLPNRVSYCASISALEKCGQWELALVLLREMPEATNTPHEIAYNAAMSACEKGGQWQLGLALLREMFEVGARANEISYSVAISACEKGGQWELALELLQEMPQVDISPNDFCFNAGISACEPSGNWQVALGMLDRMRVEGHVPSGITVGAVCSGVRKMLGKDKALDALNSLAASWEADDEQLGILSSQKLNGLRLICNLPGFIALSKPGDISTQDALERVAQKLECEVHEISRLDLPTSGVLPMTLGTHPKARKWFQAQFAARLVHKEYVCLCLGAFYGPAGAKDEVCSPLLVVSAGQKSRCYVSASGKEAHTRFEVLETLKMPASAKAKLSESSQGSDTCEERSAAEKVLTLLKVNPLTGRTHQIRCHMASIGLPLVGDIIYGVHGEAIDSWCPRLFLHCRRLSLFSLAAEALNITADLPLELERVLQHLRA